jgi:uncharacterized repeat protein (TIGR01451 family)
VIVAQAALLAAPASAASSYNLDQCRNGTFASPKQCTGDGTGSFGWVNGNAGATQAHWREGEYIAYRARLAGLTTGSNNHSIHMQWDTTQNNRHAIDYIGTYNTTETTADPCSSVSGCGSGSFAAITVAIPHDSMTNGMLAGHSQESGVMTCFGCSFLQVNVPVGNTNLGYDRSGAFVKDDKQGLTFNFRTNVANPVFAWGGHIASQFDWGTGKTAISINGSPYHMRVLDLDGGGGSQDRSLSAAAVAGPPNLSTQVSNTSVSVGSTSVTDTATFTGSHGTVTGTATFFLCGPQNPATGCTQSDATRVQVGGVKTLVGGVATSDGTSATLGLGTYCFGVLYTNDGASFYANGYFDSSGQLSTECFTVTQAPTIDVSKVADASPVDAGNPIGFTITVTAGGTGTANNVQLSDTLPDSGLSWTIDSGTGQALCSIAAGVLSCNFGNMASGANYTVHISSPTTGANCGTVNNTASVTTDNAGSANDSDSIVVNCHPTIDITKTADASPVDAGNPIGFTVTVTAGGTGTANNVTVSDNLPDSGLNWTIDAANSDTGCTITGAVGSQVLSCNFGNLTGESRHVHITSPTTGANCGTVSNTASVSTDNAGSDQATATIDVVCHPTIDITKTADASPVVAGTPIGFTVTVTAGGTGTATNVLVSDTLPDSGLTWSIDGGTGAGSCSIGLGVLSCSFGDMASGASFTVHISSPTTGANCGTVSNTASVSTDNAGTDQDTASIVVNCPVTSRITPTATTCSQFNDGSAATLASVNYAVRNGKISQVDPGVFFYWVKVTATAGSNTFTIDQETDTTFDVYFATASGSAVYTSTCAKLGGTSITQSNGDVTVTFTASSAGTYIIGIKYNTGTVKGATAPSPSTVQYSFTTSGTPNSTSSLNLVKKP